MLLGNLSSSSLYAHSVNVLICRDHGDRWGGTHGRGGEGTGVLGRQGEGRGSMQHCYFLFGSHSLSALIPDRWREGRVGAKRLSPQAGRAGGGCFVSMVCVGREAAGGLAAWPPRSLFPRNLGVGSTWMLWGRKVGEG